MPQLFTYSIENTEEKLVVTIGGSLIRKSLNNLNAVLESNGSFNINVLLSPILPISRILSKSVSLTIPEQNYQGEQSKQEYYSEFLNQSIDQTYEDFQQQMYQIKESIKELKIQRQTSSSQVKNKSKSN